MKTDNDSTVQVQEQKFLFTKVSFSIKKNDVDKQKITVLQSKRENDEALSTEHTDLDEHRPDYNSDIFEIKFCGSRKVHISKSLFSLRSVQFFWFSSGSVISPFLSLVLTHRGMTLSEFSSVFSMLFLVQLTVAYIFGIIADKWGNVKPSLLFLMLGTLSVTIGLLLSPNLRSKSCLEHDLNQTCLNVSNYTLDLEYCKHGCSRNDRNDLIIDADNNNRNGSHASPKIINNLSSNGLLRDAFFSNETISFCSEICSCLNQFESNCLSTSKIGLKMLYSAWILCFYSLWSRAYRFIDFAALNLAKQHNSDFGKERLFAMLGILVTTALCNFVINIDTSEPKGYYDNILWFSVVLMASAVISACNIRYILLPPGIKLTEKTLKMFTNVQIMSLFILAFVAGCSYTFNRFFHLYFLESLKASKRVIGFHIMTYSLYGLPMYITSKWWIRKLGTMKILVICLLGYSINAASYSFLYHPWISLIIEFTSPLTYHLFAVALIRCREVAPEGLAATVNAVAGTVHSGIGRSFSVSVGGHLMNAYGARTAFRILASFSFVTAISYSMVIFCKYLLCNEDRKGKSEDPEEMKSMRENEA